MLSTDLGYKIPQAQANGATDAMMVYENQDITSTPKYRIWDGSSWGAEQSASTITGDIAHMEVKYAPTRDEAIMIIQSTTGEISAQVFNGTSWGSKTVLGTVTGNGVGADIQASNGRCFDFFYEQTSGDAIAVYCDNSADPDYRVWNGSSWSGATNIDIPTTGIISSIEAANRSGSDEGAFITNDANSDVYGMRWTGSAWNNMGVATAWETTSSLATKKPIDVAFEKTSGDIMFAWGFATVATAHFRYRTYTQSNSTLNAVTNVTNANNGGVVHWLQLAADPATSSDKIMIGVEDAGADINTFEWSGSAWSAVHTEHSAGAEDILDQNFDITYETHASNASDLWLAYGNSATVTRKKYESTGTWGTSTTAGDDTALVNIIAQPNNGAVLSAVYEDNTSATDDIRSFQLTGGGTTWSSPATVWAGPVARNLGFLRLDMAGQAYGGSNEAIMVYDTQSLTDVPKYRQWTGSSWGAEQSATAVDGEIAHLALKFSPTKNEALLVTQSTTGKIQSQTWNGSSWGSVTTFITITGNGLGADQKALNGQAFDIAYEKSSGDALVLYADETADPNYRTWNGTSWSGETDLNVPGTGIPNVIELTGKDGSDEIGMILMDANIDVYGMRWTGSAWDNMGTAAVWDATGSLATKHAVDVAYESSSGDGMFIWGDSVSTDYYYRTYSGGVLGAATLLDMANSGGVGHWVTLEADPNSDKIMLGALDAGSDLNTVEWDGSAWGVPHTEHSAGTEDVVDRNFDMVYETHASNTSDLWLSFGNATTVTRKKYESTGTWGTSTTTGDDTAFIDMEAHPVSGAILTAVYEDNTSATDDLLSFQLTGGSTTWSGNTTIWGGPVARNAGFDRLDIEVERYNPPQITVSGTCKKFNKSTNCADGETVSVYVNTTSAGSTTTSGGTWTLNITQPSASDKVTIFISGVANNLEANAFALYNGSGNLTSVPLIEDTLTLFNGGSQIGWFELGAYDNSVSGNEDIFFDIDGSGNLTVDNTAQSSQERLYIATGTAFQTNRTINTVNFENYGTFTYETGSTMNVAGSFYNDAAAAMTMQSSTTVNFTATSIGQTITSGGDSFDNLTFNGTNGVWTLQDNTTVANVLTITAGSFDAGSTTLTLSGTGGNPFINNATFTPSTSTVVYSGNNASGNTTIENTTFNNLTINNGSETYVLSGTTTTNGDLSITSGILDAVAGQNYALVIAKNFSNNGTFTARNGTVTLNNVGFTSVVSGSITFYNLTVATAGKVVQFTAGQTFTVNGLLSVTGAVGNLVSFTSTTGASTWTINHQGTESITYLSVAWGACHGSSTTITMGTGSTKDGNSGSCWSPPATGITISGTVYLSDGSTPDTATRSLKLSVNGGTAQTSASDFGSGDFSITTSSAPSTGDIFTIWINGESPKASHVIKYGASCPSYPDCSSVSLIDGTTILTSQSGSDFTNSDLSACDNTTGTGCATSDIGFDNINGLTFNEGRSLLVPEYTTFTPGGSVTIPGSLTIGGTFNAANSSTVKIGGNITLADTFFNDGVFNPGTSTVELYDAAQEITISTPNAMSFYNFKVDTPGKIVYFAANQTFSFDGLLSVVGGANAEVNFSSTGSGFFSPWYIDLNGSASIKRLVVSWAECDPSSKDINLSSDSTNGNNNGSCWKFFVQRSRGGGGGSSGGGAGSGGSGQGGGGAGGQGNVQATATALRAGTVIDSVTVDNGGSGYLFEPLVCFQGSSGSGATAVAAILSGAVISINVTNGGSGYFQTPLVIIAAPGVSGGSCDTGQGGGGAGGGGGGEGGGASP